MSTHTYDVTLRWEGTTAGGPKAYSRGHTVGPAGQEIKASADPNYGGDPDLLNPEELLVMALASCQMLTFLAVAAHRGVDVVGYVDESTGIMPTTERPVRVTQVTLRPRITVAAGTDPAVVEKLVEKGHRGCFVANSVTTEVVLEPTIIVLAGEA